MTVMLDSRSKVVAVNAVGDVVEHGQQLGALARADAAPWPDASAAFTDVQTTGAGTWF